MKFDLNQIKLKIILKDLYPQMDFCSICQDTIVHGCKCTTNCNHSFHAACIKQLYESSENCPVCREFVFTWHFDKSSENAWCTVNTRNILYKTLR